jgi:hypothetical protein
LRYLQTLLDLGSQNSTIIFPLPIDLVKALTESLHSGDRPAVEPGSNPGQS